MTTQTFLKPFYIFTKWPKKYFILGILLVTIIALITGWFWPRSLNFSYAQPNCRAQLIIAPDLYKSVSRDGLRLMATDKVKVGGVSIASLKACAIPVSTPKPGVSSATLAPFGWSAIGKTFSVTVGVPPMASVKPLEKPLPVTLPVKLPLESPDRIFTYRLEVGEKTLHCVTQQLIIECDLRKLNLQQGMQYPITLNRYFNKQKVATISKRTIETLRAVTVTGSTIKPGEVVYSKPQNIQIKLDKPLVSADAKLVKVDDKGRTPITSKSTTVNDMIEVTWTEELPRMLNYEIHIENVKAKDSSTLIAPYVLPFRTSGGPRVTGINIGQSKVAMGATAILTFDQPLLESQNISKAVTVSGGAAITALKGNQLFISTAGVPKCTVFSIAITDTLQSNFAIAGGSKWQYSARTVCHTVGSIGTSVRGRAITAYYFGTGPTSVIYAGAIHGDELSTRSLMLRWIDELEANPQNIPANKTIIVIPAVNPDGAATGRRTNANNVDLNRNFDVSDWKKDVTTVTNAPFPGGGGSAPMSEPETRALANLVSRTRPRLVLSYHSVASVVAGNQAGDSVALAGVYAGLSGYRNVSGATASTFEYQVTGTSDDYYAEKLGIPSILIELGSSSYHQFDRNKQAMWTMARQ